MVRLCLTKNKLKTLILLCSFFICCILACSNVKSEPVEVKSQLPREFVINVNEDGEYQLLIVNEHKRKRIYLGLSQKGLKVNEQDSLWSIDLEGIETAIDLYRSSFPADSLVPFIECSQYADYDQTKKLMHNLQLNNIKRYKLITCN